MLTHVTRNEEQWNAFVIQNGGGFSQSWEWAELQEAMGRDVYRFRIDTPGKSAKDGEHEDTLLQFSVIFLPLPLGKSYAYIPMGPIVDKTKVRESFEVMIGAIRKSIAQPGTIFARIEPPFSADSDLISKGDLTTWGFAQTDDVHPSHSSVIDLEKDEETLLAEMHQKTRYNIRLSAKKGVTIRTASRENAHTFKEDIGKFWAILGETAVRDNFHTHERKYYEKMLDVIGGRQKGSPETKLWFAEHEGDTLAAALTIEFGDAVVYLHGASTAKKRAFMAPYLLHWEIIRDAKKRGYKKYDFWGVAPDDAPNHNWSGITRFKRGFGGARTETLGTWELPKNKFWYKLYKAAKKFR